MRRAVIYQIQGMSRRLKFNLILLLLLFVSAFMSSGLFRPQEACAAVATVNNWPATPQVLLNGIPAWTTVTAANGTITVGAGSNRAMLVVVACEYTTPPAGQKLSVSYGTKSVAQIASNVSQNSTIWLGYLNEADLAAVGSGQKLLVKNGKAANLTAMYASAAVYSGVDQTASPISGFSTQATASATTMTPTAYNVTAQAVNAGLSLVVANWNTTTATLTQPTGYTASPATYAGTNFRMGFYNKSITAIGTETPVPTVSAASGGAMVGFGLVPSGLKYTISTCADCHYYYPVDAPTTRGTPGGQFKGSHNKHAGAADGQYGYDCSRCHYNAAGLNHSTGYKNISGSSVPRNTYGGTTNILLTNNEASFSTCTKSACHSTGRTNLQYSASPTWGGTTTCLSCHAGRSATNPYPQANSTAGFKLSTTHSQHLKYPAASMNCQMCHGKTAANATTLKSYSGVMYHANGVANVIFTDLSYGSYSSYKSTTSGSSANTKVCTNVACHGGTTRSAWSNTGAANNNHTCTHCHGVPTGVATGNTNRNYYAPGYLGTGTSTDGIAISTNIRVGAHYGHLSSAYMKKLKCNECHTVPSNPFDGTHMTGPRYSSQSINFGQASSAIKNTTSTAFTSGTAAAAATCNTTYCHGSKMIYGDNLGTDRSPTWNTELITRTPGAVECERCHGNPPDSGASTKTADHTGKAATTSCNECHSHVNTNGTFNNKLLHINGQIEASGTCVGCHAVTQTGTHGTPRAAVVGEFTLAWGHKKSGRGAVTDADCIVCHLEGVFATQAPSATYHKDGNIDLRNPDGSGEVKITATFTRFATSYASGSRTSSIGTTVDFQITQQFCLKCHDADGATNTTARSGTSPNATNPFGTGKLAINNAAQFATSNSSKHPILGPLSRDYPTATRMAVPYKPTGTRGTSGTKTAGVVMNCFDCHNTPTTPLTTRTVSAHGNAVTLRGTIGVASPTLCAICHLGYTASNTVGHNSGSLTSGSAYSSAENRMQTEQDTCNNCHASAVSPARPARAEDVHGVNTVPAGGTTKTGRWLTGGANGVPIAFIRNTTNLGNHQPKQVNGQNYTVGCDMSPCRSTSGVSPYTPGGTY